MKFGKLGCKRFSRLLSEQDDRDLKPAEERFLARHREVCQECRADEEISGLALNMLRDEAFEDVPVDASFDDRVIRKLRVQTGRESLGYWSPALVGASIACVGLFVALHLAASPTQAHRANLPAGEARLERSAPNVPNLELSHVPVFTR